MTFSAKMTVGAALCLFAAGCGATDSDKNGSPQNTVEKPVVSVENDNSPNSPADVSAGPTQADLPALAPEFASLPEPYRSANYARGRRTFKLCQSCHTLAEGGPNLVGPNLHGMFGREIGSIEGFRYSSIVEDANFTWSPEKLEQWLENPRGFLPGNNMSFAGVGRPDDRTAVIAYIMVETGWTGAE